MAGRGVFVRLFVGLRHERFRPDVCPILAVPSPFRVHVVTSVSQFGLVVSVAFALFSWLAGLYIFVNGRGALLNVFDRYRTLPPLLRCL
jgi:hypothetical protein